jgi:methyltransferase (TIGR00027 family)
MRLAVGGAAGWTDVGRTALAVAAARAGESTRPDRLFDDPLAADFVTASNGVQLLGASTEQASEVWRAMGDYVPIRTRFHDDLLGAAVAGGCRQIVLLAAGLDTRAFRLPLPAGTRVFELDRPDVLAFKAATLAERAAVAACPRVPVSADLREDWPGRLLDAGFQAAEPTAWLAEGLLPYLGVVDADLLLAHVSTLSAPGSRFGFDRIDQTALRAILTNLAAAPGTGLDYVRSIAGLLPEGPAGDPVTALAGYGWRVRESSIAEVAVACGRPVPPAFAGGPDSPLRAGLVSADR